MTDPTLIEDLIKAGLPAALVGRVHNAIASATVRGQSADKMDERRERDRVRKREKRELLRNIKQPAEANDAAIALDASAETSADIAEKCCNTYLLSSLESNGKKESSSVVTRARGTRLSADAQILPADFDFARKQGHSLAAIDQMWAEFVDYWSAVPGQRGVKLNWSATWRNRVRHVTRTIGGWNGSSRQTSKSTSGQGFVSIAAKLKAADRPLYGTSGDFE